MVKGQIEKIKNKSFYIWMLSGALVVICICAVCLNISDLDGGKDSQNLNEPKVENFVENLNPNVDNVVEDELKITETEPQQEEVNLLENDIVNDAQLAENDSTEEQVAEEPEAVSVMSNDNILNNLSFDEEAGLTWPASGNVIMNYSDNKGIYFATLCNYRVNPAIMIGADEGAQVVSAAKGVVTKIFENEETGVTLEMSIGDDYNLTYGQLKDLAVKEGDTVDEGQLLGYIAKPSKYFVVEGSNLYFKVTQGEKSVNPLYLLK